MGLDVVQAIAVVLGAVGGLGWIGQSVVGLFRAQSTNQKDRAEAESMTVSTMREVIRELDARLDAMREEVNRHESQQAELRKRISNLERERNALKKRVGALEAFIKLNHDINPDDIAGSPV